MDHEEVDLILATGGPGMVHAAYTSGKPAIGVGAGNTPAVIDETAGNPDGGQFRPVEQNFRQRDDLRL